jgi:hypothetical protein
VSRAFSIDRPNGLPGRSSSEQLVKTKIARLRLSATPRQPSFFAALERRLEAARHGIYLRPRYKRLSTVCVSGRKPSFTLFQAVLVFFWNLQDLDLQGVTATLKRKSNISGLFMQFS